MSDQTTGSGPQPSADLWTGLILSALGFAFALEAWRMPRLEERGIDPMTAPGIVPGVFGGVLLLLGLLLAFRGPGDDRAHIGFIDILGKGDGPTRLAFALALNFAYALGLVGRLPFWLATLLYLLAFMSVFGLQPGGPGAVKRAVLIVIVSAAATAGIVYLFETLFYVRLP